MFYLDYSYVILITLLMLSEVLVYSADTTEGKSSLCTLKPTYAVMQVERVSLDLHNSIGRFKGAQRGLFLCGVS